MDIYIRALCSFASHPPSHASLRVCTIEILSTPPDTTSMPSVDQLLVLWQSPGHATGTLTVEHMPAKPVNSRPATDRPLTRDVPPNDPAAERHP